MGGTRRPPRWARTRVESKVWTDIASDLSAGEDSVPSPRRLSRDDMRLSRDDMYVALGVTLHMDGLAAARVESSYYLVMFSFSVVVCGCVGVRATALRPYSVAIRSNRAHTQRG